MNKIKPFILIVCILLSGCRGYRTDKPAIHINPNMDWQPKYEAQEYSHPIPKNTIAWGNEESWASPKTREVYNPTNTAYFYGKTASQQWVTKAPIDVTLKTIKRGQERYNIYCALCHDQAGTGKGTVVKRGFLPPPDFSDPRILKMSDGEFFDVITNGARNMSGYKKQIPVQDRWAIVTYIRALQKSRSATPKEVSKEILNQLNNGDSQ